MSHYSFRHGKSHSTASSSPSSGNHQRVTYGSRSTSTGTPPQTPTIRVTSPVPDAVGVIDIWDPEVTDDEPQASIPKSYSFRYNEEEKKQQQQQNEGKSSSTAESPSGDRKKKVYTDSGMQADSSQQQQTSQDASTAAKIPTSSLSNHHLNDDDGLKSSESAEESSDCEEMSQISAVTQVLRCSSPNETEGDPVDDKNHSSETVIEPESVLPSDDPKEPHPDSDSMPPIDKPVKRVQFSRSLSLVPGSNASQSAVNELMTDGQRAGTRSGAGRRYSSLDSTTCSAVPFDILPSSTFTFVDQLPASGGKMLSPTPESALENAQSPQQEEDQIIILEQIVDQNVQQSATPANVTSTTLSGTMLPCSPFDIYSTIHEIRKTTQSSSALYELQPSVEIELSLGSSLCLLMRQPKRD